MEWTMKHTAQFVFKQIIMIIIIMASVCCCSCKGVSAECVCCGCVRKKVPCKSCFLNKSTKCQNSLSCRQKKVLSKPISLNSESVTRSPLLTGLSVSSLLLDTNVSTIKSQLVLMITLPVTTRQLNHISIDTLGNDTNGTQS